MKLYLSHLRGPDSVIAIHISNLAVDLTPPTAALASLYGMNSALVVTSRSTEVIVPSQWVLLSQGNSLNVPEIQSAAKPVLAFADKSNNVWTDDYSNVFSLLDYRSFSIDSWFH